MAATTTAPRTVGLGELSEAQFQQQVIELAERYGWRVHHHHDSRRQVAGGRLVGDKRAAGFPDLVLVKDERLIFAELKRDGEQPRANQHDWLCDLCNIAEAPATNGRVHVTVWRPEDFAAIVARLSAPKLEPVGAAA